MRFSFSSAFALLLTGLVKADNVGASDLSVVDQSRRSLMPFTVYDDESAWNGAAGALSWEVDFEYVSSTLSFRTTPVDVESTDGNNVFSLETVGSLSGIAEANMKINSSTNRARMRVASDEPTVKLEFAETVKAWGAHFTSGDDAGGTDLEIEVVCPGGNFMMTLSMEPEDAPGFSGFVLKTAAATGLIFRQGTAQTTSDANTLYMYDSYGVTGTKSGGGWGDPHFKMWGTEDKWFDFMGECDMVLLHVPNFERGLDLTIHVRTTIRYDYSYISSAAIQIGDDILEVASYAEYFLNGVDLTSTGALNMELEGFPIVHEKLNKKRDKFDIVIGKHENITLGVYRDIVSVDIAHATPEHFGKSTGLMGSFFTEQMIARDGKTVVEDALAFGQEWQVLNTEPTLFQDTRAPQHPKESCRLPTKNQMQARRLGERNFSKAAAEEACAQVSGEMKKACVFDVIAMGDIGVAENY